MAVNIFGILSIVLFYIVVILVGVWAAWKTKNTKKESKSVNVMVGGRNMNLIVGSLTMTATWVGGGFINGTAESIYMPGNGLLWTIAPFCYSLGLIINGLVFAKRMREKGYVTILDPLQMKLGRYAGIYLYLPALIDDILYCASILSALGATLSVVADIDSTIAIVISATVTMAYTMVGGLYSVAYTDIVQLFCIFLGLWVTIPFALNNDAVDNIVDSAHGGKGSWLGEWDSSMAGAWIDMACLVTFGGIPVQAVFQRVLAADSPRTAKLLCIFGGCGSFIMTIPPVLIGAIAASTNWNSTAYMGPAGETPAENGQERMILPIVLQYLTPTAVSFFGLGAVSAAVTSSVDSQILASSSLFTRNVYNMTLRRHASEREILWVMRLAIAVVTTLSTVVALTVKSVYELFYLCADFLYVLLFPQFVAVLYFNPNSYGSLFGYVTGLVLRLGGGEETLNWLPFISYPGGINFPYKTFSMIMSFATLISISKLTNLLFDRKILPRKYDIFECMSVNQVGENCQPPSLNVQSAKDKIDHDLVQLTRV